MISATLPRNASQRDIPLRPATPRYASRRIASRRLATQRNATISIVHLSSRHASFRGCRMMHRGRDRKVARINLYVPNELKARIDQRTDINWSAEFQRLAEEKTSRDWLIVATEGAVRHVNHNNDSKMTNNGELKDEEDVRTTHLVRPRLSDGHAAAIGGRRPKNRAW